MAPLARHQRRAQPRGGPPGARRATIAPLQVKAAHTARGALRQPTSQLTIVRLAATRLNGDPAGPSHAIGFDPWPGDHSHGYRHLR